MPLRMIVYNTMLMLLLLAGSPIFVPLTLATPKWRRILLPRLGFGTSSGEKAKSGRLRTIWIHALSVGEVTAAQPLVEALRRQARFDRIVVSSATLTGFTTAGRLLKGCEICYFPFDWIGSVRRTARRVDPEAVIIIETDLWPNFLYEMRRLQVPVFLANVRMADKTFAVYRHFRSLAGMLYGTLSKIAVQSEPDRQRFLELGIPAERLGVAGNIKFDAPDQALDHVSLAQWRERLRIAGPLLVAGSTHAGEEGVVLEAVRRVKAVKFRLIIVPRDPLRAAGVVQFAQRQGFSARPLSALGGESDPPDVLVIDRLGLLKTLYGLADVAFVGGSLVKRGGHNPLEPAAWGRAILFGPDMRDFAGIARWLIASGGALQIGDSLSMAEMLQRCAAEPDWIQDMGRRSLSVFQAHKGAVQRTLSFFGMHTPVRNGSRMI